MSRGKVKYFAFRAKYFTSRKSLGLFSREIREISEISEVREIREIREISEISEVREISEFSVSTDHTTP